MSDADHRNPQQPYPDQGWQPLPQGGEYESEATAFVQLPEGFTTGAYGAGTSGYGTPGADPLAAPGHGYTPPASFTRYASTPPIPGAGTDPSATGQWTMPFADSSAGYADPSAGYAEQQTHDAHQGHAADPAGYQGGAPEAAQPWGDRVDWPVAGGAEAAAGPWSVPAADDGQEESGEYLVGDESRSGHAGLPGHGGHSGHPGHPGLAGPGAAGYQDAGYGGYGAGEGAADTDEAGRTGHWNFATGLTATSGAAGDGYGAAEALGGGQDTPHGGTANDPFGGPVDDPYAPHGGQPVHEDGAGGLQGGDPYGAGAGGTANGGATGHWSLPADALAQWPPATDTPQHGTPHDGTPHDQGHAHQPHPHDPHPHDPHAHGGEEAPGTEAGPAIPGAESGADGWTVPVAPGEQPDESGAFALAAGDGNGAGTAYGAQETYDGSPALDGEPVAHAAGPQVEDAEAQAAGTGAQQEPQAHPEAGTSTPAPEEPAPAADAAPDPDGRRRPRRGRRARGADRPVRGRRGRRAGRARPRRLRRTPGRLLRPARQRHRPAGHRRLDRRIAALRPARAPRPRRRQGRLLAGRVRGLLRPGGRAARRLLPGARGHRGGQRGPHRRGARPGRHRLRRAARPGRLRSRAVRLLRTGHGDDRARPPGGQPRPQRAGDPQGAVRQPLPLLRLPRSAGRRRRGRQGPCGGGRRRRPPDRRDTVLIPHQAGPADPTGPAPHDQDSGHHPHDPLTHGAHHEGPGADPQTGGPA